MKKLFRCSTLSLKIFIEAQYLKLRRSLLHNEAQLLGLAPSERALAKSVEEAFMLAVVGQYRVLNHQGARPQDQELLDVATLQVKALHLEINKRLLSCGYAAR